MNVQQDIRCLELGDSPVMRDALDRARLAATTDKPVLIVGKPGACQEAIARFIHTHGPRASEPFVVFNCRSTSVSNLQLFGCEKGAWEGCQVTWPGALERVGRGTLFFDEIADLDTSIQGKICLIFYGGPLNRVGGVLDLKFNARIIAATQYDLAQRVKDGSFREQFHYFLNAFSIRAPELRARREDIRQLVWYVIRKREQSLNRRITTVPDSVMNALLDHCWPGNVLELEDVIEHALMHGTGDTLELPAD